MKLSVIIVTLGRPQAVERALKQLHEQIVPVHQIIVVDGDDKEAARSIAAQYPGVLYLRNPNGFGRMTGSRNLGLLHCTGEVIAYIDDDAYVHPQWVREIVAPYADPKVGGVGGRALNDIPGEESRHSELVGTLNSWGEFWGYFGVDTGEVRQVDHIIGCNMSFRADILGELGGFHEFYPGFCSTYEEADLCLRIQKLGFKILFNPRAVLDHEGAPRKVGSRTNVPNVFRVTRNHATLLVRNYGIASAIVWKYYAKSSARFLSRLVRRRTKIDTLKWGAGWGGLLVGTGGGFLQWRRQKNNLRRRDRIGKQIRAHLGTLNSKGALQNGAPNAEANAETKELELKEV